MNNDKHRVDIFQRDRPPFLWQVLLWIFLGLAVVIGGCNLVMSNANAAIDRDAKPSLLPKAEIGNEDEVRIGVSCGTLVGEGEILIVDPLQQKIYRLPFTCAEKPRI